MTTGLRCIIVAIRPTPIQTLTSNRVSLLIFIMGELANNCGITAIAKMAIEAAILTTTPVCSLNTRISTINLTTAATTHRVAKAYR
ncbi:hypothetical protein MBAV_002559 [Candidatus Magnetobacterium bavaricum]|uniref:Uncharacterized protein n=1 Tax=Candidatus Magnetobacterium bavaricum TaxID=29290 RepID=A0A0F3GTS1_9BACT|nr:hypothetical protein MBAV_002559 [Candidatus Magnetobacterium bavaricum]